MNTKSPNHRESSFAASILHRLLFAGACFTFTALASAQDTTPPAAPATTTPPAASTSSSSNEETITLPSFTVNTDKDVGYRAENSVSATRVNASIADLPFSISALTSQFIQDTQPSDLTDIARYAAGVTSGSKEFNAGADSFTIRGFQQFPERNGFNEQGNAAPYVDPVNIERVEVVKGPAALLYGQVNPGGTVNYITKQAQPNFFVEESTTVGSDDYLKQTLDLNVPLLDKDLLFRFNGGYTNGLRFEDIPGKNKAQTQVYAPTATWNVTKNFKLIGDFQSFYRIEHPAAVYQPNMDVGSTSSIIASMDTVNNGIGTGFGASPSAALSNINAAGIDAGYKDGADVGFAGPYPGLPSKFDYDNTSDIRRTDLQSANLEADNTFNDNWVGRTNFDYSKNSNTFNQTGVGDVFLAAPGSLTYNGSTWAAPAGTFWNTTGLTGAALTAAQNQQNAANEAFASAILANPAAAMDGLPAIIARRPRQQQQWGDAWSLQPELAGKYDFSWGKIQPLLGAFFDKDWETTIIRQNTGTAASPYYPTWDVDPNSPTYYINQQPTPILPSSYTSLNQYSENEYSDQALYAYLTSKFWNDRIIVDGGYRYNRSQSQTVNYLATTGAVGTGIRTHYATPEAGIGFKVTHDSMVYADFSESYTFTGGTLESANSTDTASNFGAPLNPTIGQGEEVGYKSDFLNGRLSSTVAVYRILETNVVQTLNQISPVNGATLPLITQGADIESKGVEFECTLTPIDQVQIQASVAEDDVRYSKEPPGSQIFLGSHPAFTSKTLANLWARYNFDFDMLKGLWVGAGFQYTSSPEGNAVNPYLEYPSYTLFNSAIGYDGTIWKLNYSAVINWDNMSNKVYYPADQEEGLPSRVEFTFTLHY